MSDDFEDLLKRWLRDRAGRDRSALRALAGSVATLPPRRRRQPSQLAAAAAVIIALGLAGFALAPRFSSGGGTANGPVAPDPAAFAGDSRLARCGASVDTASDAFEMAHARDYRRYLPAMGSSPELDVETPAFVVVYRSMQPFPVFGAAPPPGQTWKPRSLEPGRHDICVLVGTDAATAEMTVYSDVDISGLTIDVVPSDPSPSELAPTPMVAPPSTTPEPAPAWAGNLAGQLDCDGPQQPIGGEVGELTPVGGTGTASPWPWLYAEDVADLPLEGWTEEPKVPWETGASDFMRYVNAVNGRIKAVLIMGGHSIDGDPVIGTSWASAHARRTSTTSSADERRTTQRGPTQTGCPPRQSGRSSVRPTAVGNRPCGSSWTVTGDSIYVTRSVCFATRRSQTTCRRQTCRQMRRRPASGHGTASCSRLRTRTSYMSARRPV
jgi:hypothetical protein